MISLEYYIYNHICIEWDRIDESKGIPDGLRDDAKYIAAQVLERKEIGNCKNFTVNIDTSKLNIKFKSLICKVIDYSGNVSYADINTSDRYSEDTVIKLHIAKTDFLFKKLIPLVGHELLHWYTYVLNGEKESESVFNKRLYRVDQNILFTDSKTPNEELIKKILYYLTPDEINAFMAELILYIEQERPSTVEEAYNILFKSGIYTGYVALYNKFMKNASSDDSVVSSILDVYRKLNTHDETLSDARIIHKLRRQFENVRIRMIKTVPRVMLNNKTSKVR